MYSFYGRRFAGEVSAVTALEPLMENPFPVWGPGEQQLPYGPTLQLAKCAVEVKHL